MIRTLSVFQILLGLAYLFVVAVFATSMLGITNPILDIRSLLWWAWMLAPLGLLIGGILVVINLRSKLGSVLTLIGATALTSWMLYFMYGIVEEISTRGRDNILLTIGIAAFVLVIAADLAAYKIARSVSFKGLRAKSLKTLNFKL
jgi:FtsH-binding integral membrane protein